MIFITGPMFSGKREFACSLLHCSMQELSQHAVWDVQDLAARRDDLAGLARELAAYPVVIATETGCGVVPIEADRRAKREAAGRLACLLSKEADTVVRICCGLPQVLKGELHAG
ncbi:MAG: bifunctional adenosylcobinamide kinase/adenosylcobinamide-phosphate guanylyltransferase [Lachnospiraceae bacterium]|nr:bifunctional adenosylcobinamide kinase/adenosylcobinamide-phosphate guanylyltransferase [Lachnospiraceae bacterium]